MQYVPVLPNSSRALNLRAGVGWICLSVRCGTRHGPKEPLMTGSAFYLLRGCQQTLSLLRTATPSQS